MSRAKVSVCFFKSQIALPGRMLWVISGQLAINTWIRSVDTGWNARPEENLYAQWHQKERL